jgi:hypothetical protein
LCLEEQEQAVLAKVAWRRFGEQGTSKSSGNRDEGREEGRRRTGGRHWGGETK